MIHTVVGISLFAGFLAVAGWVAWGGSEGKWNRINVFLTVSLAITLSIGLVQRRSFFPFHMWTLFGPLAPDTLVTTRVVAMDGAGGEHAIDYRAWEPISWWELGLWFDFRFGEMSEAAQTGAASFLVRHADAAREAAQSGAPFRRFNRVFGPLSMPLFHTYDPVWRTALDVPSDSFVGFRWYHDRHVIRGRDWSTEPESSRLLYEYRLVP